jgi:TM2 domain-containing membrane protein YozV
MMKNIISIIAGLLLVLFAFALAEAKNIIKIGDDITIERDQEINNVINIGGQVTVNGLIENNVLVAGGSVVLAGNAVVRGNVVCIGGVIVKSNGAQVFGDITEINSSNIATAINSAIHGEWEGWSWIFAVVSICFFFVIFIFALLITLLIPRPIIVISGVISSRKIKSFLWGVLGMMLIGPFAVLLAISIVGIPLIPLEFALVVLAGVVGFISAGSLVGRFFLGNIIKGKEPGLVRATLCGLILLWLIGWIPYIGWIIKMVVATTGLGGVLLALFTRKEQPLTSPPVNETPVKPASVV